jgi:hypothetical protein
MSYQYLFLYSTRALEEEYLIDTETQIIESFCLRVVLAGISANCGRSAKIAKIFSRKRVKKGAEPWKEAPEPAS